MPLSSRSAHRPFGRGAGRSLESSPGAPRSHDVAFHLTEEELMSSPIVPTLIDLTSGLRGSRVLLRPYESDDAEEVFAAVDRSRDHLRP